jgi:APA family basic amino acid/polyamine antiporter
MMVKLGWLNWARLIVWLVIGLVVYFTYGVKNSRVQLGEARVSVKD